MLDPKWIEVTEKNFNLIHWFIMNTTGRWGDEQDAADVASTEKFGLVVGSDVVYYEELIEPLLKTVELFAKGETAFVMAHLRRWKKRDATFFRKARKNFNVEVLHKDPPLPEWRNGVAVYCFTAKKHEKVD
jgi:protein N-lysine methyltransferase METTL21C